MNLLWYRILIANVPHKGFTSVPNQWGEHLGLSAVKRLAWQYRVSSAETCIWFESEIILENCKIKKYKIQPSVIRRTILWILKFSFGGDEGCILGRPHISSRWTSIILSLNQDIVVGAGGAIPSEATVNSEDDWKIPYMSDDLVYKPPALTFWSSYFDVVLQIGSVIDRSAFPLFIVLGADTSLTRQRSFEEQTTQEKVMKAAYQVSCGTFCQSGKVFDDNTWKSEG